MKKSLFALAAVGAFAGAAQAQSSVTVYGILDVGYVGGNQRSAVAGVSAAETVNQFGQSAQSSSRLGFRGTEDLGGGLSAFFTAETDLTPNSSGLWGTSNTNIANNRQAFVGLAKKGLGRAAIGTQYTLMHDSTGATSAGQNNNVIGDVIYPRNSGLGGIDSNANGSSIGYTLRASNALKLNSENISGFNVNAFYTLNDKNNNQISSSAGGNTNTNGWGIGVNYQIQKLFLTAVYQSFKSEAPTGTASVFTGGILTNTTDNQYYGGATYDFGILKAYLQYVNRKATSNLNSNTYASRSAQQIGVRGNFTKQIEGWASIGNGRYQAYGAGEPTANFTGYQIGSNYNLSKRTNLYAIFGSNQTSNTALTSNGRQNSYSGNNYAIGVRHTF
jgi:predicted porin